MLVTTLLFYVFSAILLLSALLVITARNPVYASLYLVLAFFNAAALFLLLGAEFLGLILILVYVGAVMVLFLFVVMMLDINLARLQEGFLHYLPLGLAVAILGVLELAAVFWTAPLGHVPAPAALPANADNTRALGGLLYTQYLYPFEIAAVILLIAIIAAIALTLRRRPQSKTQDIGRQLAVKVSERLRLVDLRRPRP
ncbi:MULTISPECIES: NADH-quinone oxidoreductase subunit J [Acidithiobacillus]|jgi:NADH-quinone oxidoreductase subunit J|uniref:NADH-quinone oxidoreductase subunit J n=3 Tax=Acidithiobacillus caldus TaxID=33059 RepID=F9ZSJ0_ACICS|nr:MULTISPECIES: NADH-quinone oxidoreductase subunit J [Acidithiobacillus]AEK59194.1 NADH-ubiquinone oxidoreductase chain J [Acidithiobacillus caldus SM-1]AIA56237.1 NADH-ubiquinone oxidoreductase chain J [Acidithiobacillus caldus ATCC 51756]AUW33580.1 NADH-quinone oxidoreductase subunit J [Acidithiobacillus caldus]MBU2729943.1 NADH-quinone oxidoreductase subunit J [Acidithiobacillus caldus]MBU2735272.1 NADH-quinone oxidoreductase subunit J [Acidithiobacillus caldus ATCC 51756]